MKEKLELVKLDGLIGDNSNSKEDVMYLKEYITSLDMLKKLDEKINIRELYQKQKLDFMYSLHSFTKQESYLKYYQNMVSANFDDVSGLKISQKKTELNTMLSYLNKSAPQVVTLRAEIKALNAQLEKEKNKVTSDLPQDKLNNVALEFQNLALEFGFAEDVYKAALKAVETTRIEMSRKVKQLVVIQSQTTPESAEYPNKSYNIFTIFIVLTLLYRLSGLVRMIMAESRF